jgi:hypothetical protein
VRDATLAALRVQERCTNRRSDYMTGANRVPVLLAVTPDCRRSISCWTTWQDVSPAAASAMTDDVGRFADAAYALRAPGNDDGDVMSERLGVCPGGIQSPCDPQRAPVELDLTDNTNLCMLDG